MEAELLFAPFATLLADIASSDDSSGPLLAADAFQTGGDAVFAALGWLTLATPLAELGTNHDLSAEDASASEFSR